MSEQQLVEAKQYLIRFTLILKNGETRYTKPEKLQLWDGEQDYIEPAVLRAIETIVGSEYTLCTDPTDSEKKDRVVANGFVAEYIPYVFDVQTEEKDEDFE